MAETTDSNGVALDAAAPADATLLANLLELYIHDLSAAFPSVELGPDGRFGYPGLDATGRSPTAGSRSSSDRRPGGGVRAGHAGLPGVRRSGGLRRR